MESILKTYGDRLTVESVTQTLNDIKDRYREAGMTVENVTVILLSLMNEMNRFKRLTGSQKKTLVILILTHFVTELTTEENQAAMKEFIKLTVPTLIDNFIDISKGLELKNLKKKFFCC